MARLPPPGTAVPIAFAFSPDDRHLTFLHSPEGTLERQLYALDPATGDRRVLARGGVAEDALDLEEELRRERQRELGLGVSRYAWAREAGRILVPLADGAYVLDGTAAELRRVVGTEDGPVLDPSLSPDGSTVAFVRESELHVVPAGGGPVRQLTSGARGTGRSHGLAEFVAQEEMGRASGYWWSRDGVRLAVAEVDDTHVPPYRIVHQASDLVGDAADEEHRYPFAGGPNATVRLAVIPAAGGDPVWLDLPDEECYLARVVWMPDGTLMAQVENRAQTRLDVLRFDPRTGEQQAVLTETTEVWINLHDLFRPLERAGGGLEGGFLWGSERTGFRHLYLCDGRGSVVRPLTEGEWVVDSLDGVDEEAGVVYVSGTRDGPTQRHLYAVPLEGGEPRLLTDGPGTHHVTVDHRCRRYVDVHSGAERQPTVTLRSLDDGRLLHTVHDAPDRRVEELGLAPPQLVSFRARDGTELHGAVHRPDADVAVPPYATVVSVYGGPHVQRVTDSWALTADMRAQQLRSLGCLVLLVDNRGSARRGLAFEAAVRGDLGRLEVEDQVDGVRWLADQGLADPERVGVYGWSYGGYLAAMCMARAPGVFKAAVAGAPVTHWDGYDTHYTERYMGTPESNPDGYRQSSVMHHVDAITGRLLLAHGLLDENVHFRHTARLVNALVRARKGYELVLLPEARHVPRRTEDRLYLEERIRDFLIATL